MGTDLEAWQTFLNARGIRFETEDWSFLNRNPKRLVIRITDKRAHGFNGYGVGVAFTLDGEFLEMGGWA